VKRLTGTLPSAAEKDFLKKTKTKTKTITSFAEHTIFRAARASCFIDSSSIYASGGSQREESIVLGYWSFQLWLYLGMTLHF
jgi:hypothetical protein